MAKYHKEESLIAHYQFEKMLASQLVSASTDRRQNLYREVYERLHTELKRLGRDHAIDQNNPHQIRLCLNLIESIIPTRAVFVEYGAGDGALTEAVAQAFNTKTAVAMDSSALSGRPKYGESQTDGVVNHPKQLAGMLNGASIDLAFSCHFIEHLHPEDLRQHLREVSSALASNGRYLIITPNRILGPHDVSRDFDKIATGLHLKEYTHSELLCELKLAGFWSLEILSKSGRRWHAIRTRLIKILELMLWVIPRGTRATLLEKFGRAAPFRALEQVIILATKS